MAPLDRESSARYFKDLQIPAAHAAFVASVSTAERGALAATLATLRAWDLGGQADLASWADALDAVDGFLDGEISRLAALTVDAAPAAAAPAAAVAAAATAAPAVRECLRFTTLLLRNARNKHLYSSLEHLSALLGARDEVVAELAAEAISALVTPVMIHHHSDMLPDARDTAAHGNWALSKRLLCLAQGWGSAAQGKWRGPAPTLSRDEGP